MNFAIWNVFRALTHRCVANIMPNGKQHSDMYFVERKSLCYPLAMIGPHSLGSSQWHHLRAMVSQIIRNSLVCSKTCCGWQHWTHQNSALLALYVTGGFVAQWTSNMENIYMYNIITAQPVTKQCCLGQWLGAISLHVIYSFGNH